MSYRNPIKELVFVFFRSYWQLWLLLLLLNLQSLQAMGHLPQVDKGQGVIREVEVEEGEAVAAILREEVAEVVQMVENLMRELLSLMPLFSSESLKFLPSKITLEVEVDHLEDIPNKVDHLQVIANMEPLPPNKTLEDIPRVVLKEEVQVSMELHRLLLNKAQGVILRVVLKGGVQAVNMELLNKTQADIPRVVLRVEVPAANNTEPPRVVSLVET